MVLCANAQEGGFSLPPDTVNFAEPSPYIDSGEKPPKARLFSGRPGKAALYSLILPGAGQAYNKRYWKVPIVWGVMGGVGYIMYDNIQIYKDYKFRYEQALINGSDPDNEYTTEQLRLLRNQSNKNRQLTIFLFAFAWMANSIEAYTDAHLMEFDIDEDLSIEILPPGYDLNTGSLGMGISFRF